MAISAKQLGMAWINSKLAPEKIDPEEEELQVFNNGKPIKPDVLAKAVEFIHEDLAKMKIRYQTYTEKYVGSPSAPAEEPEADDSFPGKENDDAN